MSKWLEGKVAIVTGAGRGIGLATAHLLAAHGARIVAADLDKESLAATAAMISNPAENVQSIAGDVTEAGFAKTLVNGALEVYGGLDILVNNAGFTWDGTLHKMTDQQWQSMLDVHLTAPFRIIRAAAPYLRETAKREIAERGRARARKIVNVSSTSGTRGNFGQANYAAAKAGVVGLTRTLAREWGRFNIQANCVAFGLIDTRLTGNKETGEKILRGQAQINLGIPAAMRQDSINLIPLGRPGTPAEAAGAILFFASPLSDYVSGQVLEVTGGY
jgi:3-oxoacyl-[acyl-carrier protein] reductase